MIGIKRRSFQPGRITALGSKIPPIEIINITVVIIIHTFYTIYFGLI